MVPRRRNGLERVAVGTDADAVLVVGGTGFIGSAVLRELIRARTAGGNTPILRVLSRRPLQAVTEAAEVQHVVGDLGDPSTLRGICSGIGTVIHAASYVGRDVRQCEGVNHLGTRALIEEADRHGVRRFVYVSTASVYGAGPHRGPHEGQLNPAPASPASTSRLRAEDEVRAAGGTVLRPHLVYGAGDRWFVPTLVRVLRQVPSWPKGASARNSVIAVEDLARVIVTLARWPWPHGGGETYHVADPRPLSMGSLLVRLQGLLGLPEPRWVPSAEHRTLVRHALPGLSDHQYALLTEDHWYDTGRIWHKAELDPGPGFEKRFAACSSWYEDLMAGSPGA
ncbi:NAD-dependent epimerase/dehydratase family protein [Streptomyces sp. NPDC002838]|uniref:NAD-dependent epimerase/dehydratase family protein n=1 Tax=Streptomyces sp. NPDC002838 TaxID=3154436 RepID=UPI00331E402E